MLAGLFEVRQSSFLASRALLSNSEVTVFFACEAVIRYLALTAKQASQNKAKTGFRTPK